MIKNAFAYSGELRKDNDIKQEAIAKMLGIYRTTYSRYESRENGNSHGVFDRACKVL